MEFDAFVADTLTGVSMYFPPIRPIRTVTTPISFLLRIWHRLGSSPTDRDSIIYQSSEVVGYAQSLQGFTRFSTTRPVAIPQGKFYVGWQQIANVENEVRVGYDLNYTDSSRFWYNREGTWTKFTGTKGALMIRPEFGTFQSPSATVYSKNGVSKVRLFPNPVSGNTFYIDGCTVVEAGLYNLQGKKVCPISIADSELSFAEKPKIGMYLLLGTDTKGNSIRERIVVK
jgi:hypothetical protein